MKAKDILFYIFGGGSMRSWLYFFLSFSLVFGLTFAGYANSSQEQVTHVYIDKDTNCIAAWNTTTGVVVHPDWEGVGVPEEVIVENVRIPLNSVTAKYLERRCVISF